ncbi:MAG TPA: DUF1259 domain-containing protein [Bryobacteraceae bacterium]|nr:DUF1259 domain-containing protein [Bryobacteraceae bacterium]
MIRVITAAAAVAAVAHAALTPADHKRIDEITGVRGFWVETESVYRVHVPRNDVQATVDRAVLPPFMGLTSWAAFTSGARTEAMLMGDLVLLEDEVNPVMSAALDAGLDVTALHNHFFYDSPRIMFMHISGEGRLDALARGVRRCVDRVRSVRAGSPAPAAAFRTPELPAVNSISAAPLDRIFKRSGQAQNGMYKQTIGRAAHMHDRAIGAAMGVNTWAAFAGTDTDAVVDGDFAMLSTEVTPVLKKLRSANINIVAIHNHMTHEEPRYVFLHYWGRGRAADLARTIRAALDLLAPDQRGPRVGGHEH